MRSPSLLSLPCDSSAIIETIDTSPAVQRRLMDLGMQPGVLVRHLYCAPSGDPRAYLVDGTVIALTKENASHIYLRGGIQ